MHCSLTNTKAKKKLKRFKFCFLILNGLSILLLIVELIFNQFKDSKNNDHIQSKTFFNIVLRSIYLAFMTIGLILICFTGFKLIKIMKVLNQYRDVTVRAVRFTHFF